MFLRDAVRRVLSSHVNTPQQPVTAFRDIITALFLIIPCPRRPYKLFNYFHRCKYAPSKDINEMIRYIYYWCKHSDRVYSRCLRGKASEADMKIIMDKMLNFRILNRGQHKSEMELVEGAIGGFTALNLRD